VLARSGREYLIPRRRKPILNVSLEAREDVLYSCDGRSVLPDACESRCGR